MSDDGLTDLGKDRTGKRWWRARLYWTDPRTGAAKETRRKFSAASKAAALTRRDELTEQLRTGGVGERVRFRVAADAYPPSIAVASTRASAESFARTLNAHFGDWWLDQVTVRAMQEWLDTRTGPSVNNLRNALVGIWRLAVENGWAAENLAKKVERRRADPAPEGDEDELEDEVPRDLTAEQLAAYLDDLEEHEPELYPLVLTQFVLGCRFSEVSALRKDRLNLETGIVQVRRGQWRGHTGRTKGKRGRKVALPLEVRAELKRHLARMAEEQWPGWEEQVFPRPAWRSDAKHTFWASTTIATKIGKSFARCGIVVKGKTHVARHTMITIAESVTPSEALLRKVVGHRSKRTHLGYQNPGEARVIHLGEAVGREMLKGRTGNKTGTASGKNRSDR